MRSRALAVAPVLLALLTLLPGACSGPVDGVGTASTTFTAAPETSLRFYVPDDGLVSITVHVAQGVGVRSVTVSGAGSCWGTEAASAGSTVSFNCGWMREGEAWATLRIGGTAATGSVLLQNAHFPPLG